MRVLRAEKGRKRVFGGLAREGEKKTRLRKKRESEKKKNAKRGEQQRKKTKTFPRPLPAFSLSVCLGTARRPRGMLGASLRGRREDEDRGLGVEKRKRKRRFFFGARRASDDSDDERKDETQSVENETLSLRKTKLKQKNTLETPNHP